jgi:2-dehydropantoate 2-reductase
MMHFIVIGTGAIGTYIGGRLAASGVDVSFVGRRHSLDLLVRDGLRVTDLDGFDHWLAPSSLKLATALGDIEAVKKDPIILVCVKSGATEDVGRDVAKFCPPGSIVISLQNGVDNVLRLKTVAPRMQVLSGMVPYNVILKTASHCHRATDGTLFIQRQSASEDFIALFNAAGLDAALRVDMREVQWGKLLLNLNNPINALSNLPLKSQLEDRNYRRVLAALQTEALGVLKTEGIRPAKVGKASPALLPILLRLPDWLFKRVAASLLKMDASARSSMWVDLQSGRVGEIEDLCGAVVRLGAKHQLSTPFNSALIGLVNAYQKDQVWTGKKLRQAIGSP